MKIFCSPAQFGLLRLQIVSLTIAIAATAFLNSHAAERGGYIAHEWGTFTSVQGGDGVLLKWLPLEKSELPEFVHRWSKPGLNRTPSGAVLFNKDALRAYQRMETPVIYFYTEEKQTVDVEVKFPAGFITEWYPQATRIGPASDVSSLENMAFTLRDGKTSGPHETKSHASPESLIAWSNVKILPRNQGKNLAAKLPGGNSGNHYFTAREADGNLLEVSPAKGHPIEHEEFLFYRGVGNFSTPLTVSVSAANSLTLSNSGTETIAALFAFLLEQGRGQFVRIDSLGDQQSTQVCFSGPEQTKEELSEKIAVEMKRALVDAGLYDAEAMAMINTWRDSWFEEEGCRVFYLLPSKWTDVTLPITLRPAPRELVRVMVGRAEIITPELETELTMQLVRANQGDNAARTAAVEHFKKLGRFAEPALRQVIKNIGDRRTTQLAWELMQEASKPAVVSAL